MYKPQFTTTEAIADALCDIERMLHLHPSLSGAGSKLLLRRGCNILSLRSSLAIEGNTLGVNQVRDVLDGVPVVATEREIREVRNAAAAYELIPKLRPTREADLLRAHAAMMRGLVTEPGHYRRCDVLVVNSATGERLHTGTPPEDVPALIAELFDWLRTAKMSPLLKGPIFHQRFETIHPFDDGNGRMGRLWQSVILCRYHPVFATLPAETLVHGNVGTYYDTLHDSQTSGNLTGFLEFILDTLRRALTDRLLQRPDLPDEAQAQLFECGDMATLIAKEIALDAEVSVQDLARTCGIGQRMVKEYIARLRRAGLLLRVGGPRYGHWRLTLPGNDQDSRPPNATS